MTAKSRVSSSRVADINDLSALAGTLEGARSLRRGAGETARGAKGAASAEVATPTVMAAVIAKRMDRTIVNINRYWEMRKSSEIE
ncbi:hypothetical protein C8J55DRAFT_505818 [Lentinula edodes]|uniref:Uncharacterized protein n=1 Tax=Lentinula lateritia TaxID=40482 RepID=A0A9W9ASY6_9AGAR|nr:hypothetical protein C8J55DRAFT_505818 [Lentinula edodes]